VKGNHRVTVLRLHRETRAHFAREGIITLQQVVEMDEETLLTFRHVGQKTVHTIKRQARAYLQGSPVWFGQLPEVCCERGWYFDIETNPQTGDVWSIGWCWHDEPVRIVIVVPGESGTLLLPDGRRVTLVPDTDAAWRTFAEGVGANGGAIFHWSGFDAAVMRGQAPADVTARLDERLHDLLVSFRNTVQLPERSNSLKVVAPYAGFHWRGYQEWWAALRDYNTFLQTGDVGHLVEACHYQAGDVEAMVAIWAWLNAWQGG
jgi:predicted RecB family nuclease